MSVTPGFCRALSDEDLGVQLELLDARLDVLSPTDPAYQFLRENQDLLQAEQVRRLVQADRSVSSDTVTSRHLRFQQAVLLSARHRLTQNQENLALWRKVIEEQISATDLEREVLTQSALDLKQAAAEHGGTRAYAEWLGQPSPYMRRVEEHQAHGEWRACTGCHETVRADTSGKLERHVGPAWMSPAQRLGLAALQRIRTIVAPLGDRGYRIIPDDVFSLHSGDTPEALRSRILAKLEDRRKNYAELGKRITEGDISYLQLGPVLSDLLPLADIDVRKAVEDDVSSEETWHYINIGGTLVLALLSLLIPPVGLVFAGIQFGQGLEALSQGYLYHLGTGANTVFTREQQESAGSLMASGVVSMAQAATVVATLLPGLMDIQATRAITSSDLNIARGLGRRSLLGPVPEAELDQLIRPGLVGRIALRWADLRKFQIVYRGQASGTEEILSPVARQSGVAASRQLYDAMKAQGMTDLQIAGYTARWSGSPVPELGGLPVGGVGIPTTRLPNIAADFANSPTGVIYVLRVPKGLGIEVGMGGWGKQSLLEQEWVFFHQIPNGYVVRVLPRESFPGPLKYDLVPGVGSSLRIPEPTP